MRFIFFVGLIITLTACSVLPSLDEVLPDKRTEYKKSESLPDLEVPPDLTAAEGNDAMAIPGEDQSTLSGYNRQKSRQDSRTAASVVPVNDQWVVVKGSTSEIWPELRTFFQDKDFALDLYDAELGVLGTSWSGPVAEGVFTYRNRFKIFSEQGAKPGVLILYVSNIRQERIVQDDGEPRWIDQEKSQELEKQLVGELNLYFNKSRQQVASVAEPNQRNTAEIEDAGEGKSLLNIPTEYTHAWRQVDAVLQRAGFVIDDKDQAKGLYFITFFDSAAAKKKGWTSKLAFWKDDGSDGTPYQISLTGVGDKTELIVLNKDGDWENNDESNRILDMIRTHYNRL